MKTISRFKFLNPYEKADVETYGFFGRGRETDDLYELVMRSNLVLLYGVTGVGKSSLVRCGLANRIDESRWMDIYVRRGANLNESLREVLAQQVAVYQSIAATAADDTDDIFGDSTAAPAPVQPSDTSISALLDTLYLYTFKPVYLVFDQFEEIFTLGTHEERRLFFATLRDLQRADAHKVKAVLVMREEYFAYLDEYERVLPMLTRHRLRVERMAPSMVQQVIEGTLEKAEIGYEAGLATSIIKKLAPKERNLYQTIELTHLQMLLDKLYRIAGEGNAFTNSTLQQAGELRDIVVEFLDERIREIATAEEQTALMWQGLKALITAQGTKQPLAASALPAHFPTTQMVQAGVLRLDTETRRVELTHDILAAAIFSRLSGEERDLNDARLDIEKAIDLHEQGKRGLLDKDQLAYHQRYKQYYTPDQQEFVERSATAIRITEEKQRRSTRLIRGLGITAGVVAVAAIILMVFAFSASKEARIALKKQQEAEYKARLERLASFSTRASDYENQEKYEEAIAVYKQMLPDLDQEERWKASIEAKIKDNSRKRDSYNFEQNKLKGLRLMEAGEQETALFYLREAQKFRNNDPEINKALTSINH